MANYKDGKRDGEFIEYNKDGTIKRKLFYKDDYQVQ